MENVRVGDIVRCVNNMGAYSFLTKGKNYEVFLVGSMLRIRDDNGELTWCNKNRFRVIGGVSRQELWHDGSGRSSNNFKIELPKVYLDGNEIDYGVSEFPAFDIPKLTRQLYEAMGGKGEQEMSKAKKMNNIKDLHNDIQNIYFNEEKRTTVIVFKNGDKVKATASKDTPFSEYAGFVTALFKYEKGLKLKDVEHLIKKKRA